VGRTFVAEELREGGRPAVIVSEAFWRRVLESDRDLRRRPLRFEGRAFEVVGVMPPGFAFPVETDLWVARELWERNPNRTGHNWFVVGRLRDGVSLDAARTEMSALGKALKTRFGSDIWLTDIDVIPLREQLVGAVRPALLVLLGAVGFLLLVACANVANLLLAQLTSRRRELAVRSALGASTWQLNQQLLVEAGLLAGTGGLLGFMLAPWAVRALLALDPGKLPRTDEVAVNAEVALFTFALAAATAALLALAAGTRRGRSNVNEGLKSGGRSQGAGRGEERLRAALVSVQVALSMMLLVGAGLLGRTLFHILERDPGFRTENVVAIDLAVPSSDDPAEGLAIAEFYTELIDELRAQPGVTAAGGINGLPLTGSYADGTFVIQRPDESFTRPDGEPDFVLFSRLAKDPSRTGQAEFRVASAGYFAAMNIPLRRGRLFDERDGAEAPHVAVISETLAKRVWPHDEPLGKTIQFGNMDGDMRPFTIVGVVGDVADKSLDSSPRPTFYASYRQRTRPIANFWIVAATAGDERALASAAGRIVRRLRPDVPPRVRLVEDIVATSVADRRFNLFLLATFGIAAIVLAAIGIYGVTSFWVAQRSQEFGVRLTLGATPGGVVRMVVRRTAAVVGLGVVAGLIGSYALTRLLRSLLYEVTSTDPLTFAAAMALLVTVGLIAAIVPARRAGRVDPTVALRSEI
jgi:predicted permease